MKKISFKKEIFFFNVKHFSGRGTRFSKSTVILVINFLSKKNKQQNLLKNWSEIAFCRIPPVMEKQKLKFLTNAGTLLKLSKNMYLFCFDFVYWIGQVANSNKTAKDARATVGNFTYIRVASYASVRFQNLSTIYLKLVPLFFSKFL